MSILVAYPTTEAEIRNASDTAITISLGANTDPRYVTALQSQAAPIISMHIQKNNQAIEMKIAELVEKYNSTSMKLLFDRVLSGDSGDDALSEVETSQLDAFVAESRFFSTLSPELCAEAVKTLKASIDTGKVTTKQLVTEMKNLFITRMSELVKPPMSEADIVASRDKELQNILGSEATPERFDAFKKGTEGVLDTHLKANEAHISQALSVFSAEVNLSAVKFLDDSVRSTLSNTDADMKEFESTHIESFEKKTASLKLKHPKLHSEALTALENSLRRARAATMGHTSLAKSVAFLIECSVPGSNTSVDTCLSKAMDLWSSNVKSNLGQSWSSPDEQSLFAAAGEASAKAKMQYVAEGARSTIRALDVFKFCTRDHTWTDLHQCTVKGEAVCLPGARCIGSVQSAAVQTMVALCEKQAIQTKEKSSKMLGAWWHTDQFGVWLSPADLMDDVSVSFQKGPCLLHNSSKALDLRDQTLRDAAQISSFRSHAVWAATLALSIASLFIGVGLIASNFIVSLRSWQSPQVHLLKVYAINASLVIVATAFLLCMAFAYFCPSYTIRQNHLSGMESSTASVSAEHMILSFVLTIEGYLLYLEMKRVGSQRSQSPYEPLHSL
mmetsp:Transcript_33103/g.69236  ORF Transcript_33103/g.69236 Transcript_33103/m.69236 type:complete len:615 (-) Transcript_33103:103-1947(-)